MNKHALLLACYRSGQVSEKQWQAHLKDSAFAEWLQKKGETNGK